MAVYYATTNLLSNSGASYPVTLKVSVTSQAEVRAVEVIEWENPLVSLRPSIILDLLAEVMPKYVHSHEDIFEVTLGKNECKHPSFAYTGHPCLVVKHIQNNGEKHYRLNHCVGTEWMLTIPPAHLRAMVYWWRLNRDQYGSGTPWEWGTWKNEA